MSALSINKSRYYYKLIFVYKIIPEQNVAVLRHISCSKTSEHSKFTYFRINTSSLCNLNAYIQHLPIAIQSNPTICLSSNFEFDAFKLWKRTSMTIQKYLHQKIDMVLPYTWAWSMCKSQSKMFPHQNITMSLFSERYFRFSQWSSNRLPFTFVSGIEIIIQFLKNHWNLC